jgi:hypothetical protein
MYLFRLKTQNMKLKYFTLLRLQVSNINTIGRKLNAVEISAETRFRGIWMAYCEKKFKKLREFLYSQIFFSQEDSPN